MSRNTVFRCRNWSFIVYPDSAPADWQFLLSSLHIPTAISPLHDRDFKKDGKPDKPHHHVILSYAGNKTQAQAQEVSNICSGVLAIPVADLPAMCRYLVHSDNPEKAQYSEDDVILLSGFEFPSDLIVDLKIRREILRFVLDNPGLSLRGLIDYSFSDSPSWIDVLLRGNNYLLIQLLNER